VGNTDLLANIGIARRLPSLLGMLDAIGQTIVNLTRSGWEMAQ
jgi:hypothetical protein